MNNTAENIVRELKVDRSNWELIKFGDVAIQQKESVDRENTDITRYIKGEHMKSEDLHIREWGDLTDEYLGPAFIRKFEKGDILYGSRRTYLRKVAIAPFEGITSNTTFVIKADEKKINKKLLPFIMLSEGFANHSIKNSKGSVNPYVNWKDLANYEFLLPPKDQQAQIAELLWAMDEVVERELDLLDKLKKFYYSRLNTFMIHGTFKDSGELILTKNGLLDFRLSNMILGDCLQEKPSYGANASSTPYYKGAPRYIRITDIDEDGNLIEDDIVSIDSKEYDNYILNDGDFLFARTGNTVGKTLLYSAKMGKAVFAGYLIRFKVDTSVLNPEFLFYYTKSLKYEIFKRKMIKVGAQPNINSQEYQSMLIPQLTIADQSEVVKALSKIRYQINEATSKISSSRSLQKSLINQIF